MGDLVAQPERSDHAPGIPGEFGVDTDPETADDSLGASVEADPAEIAEPPAGADAGGGDGAAR